MEEYLALLRGINVGGKNPVKMEQLRQLAGSLGLSAVRSYIQSGNLLFRSELPEERLKELLEQAVKQRFGIACAVVLRSAAQLNALMAALPFSEQEIAQAKAASPAESLYVLLYGQPPEGAPQLIAQGQNDRERAVLIGRDLYILLHDSIRDSKLVASFGKLGQQPTARNWNTLSKLQSMLSQDSD